MTATVAYVMLVHSQGRTRPKLTLHAAAMRSVAPKAAVPRGDLDTCRLAHTSAYASRPDRNETHRDHAIGHRRHRVSDNVSRADCSRATKALCCFLAPIVHNN